MMNDHEHLDRLTFQINAQRTKCEQLYREWNAACKALNNFEREQSLIFRKIADASGLARTPTGTPLTIRISEGRS